MQRKEGETLILFMVSFYICDTKWIFTSYNCLFVHLLYAMLSSIGTFNTV